MTNQTILPPPPPPPTFQSNLSKESMEEHYLLGYWLLELTREENESLNRQSHFVICTRENKKEAIMKAID